MRSPQQRSDGGHAAPSCSTVSSWNAQSMPTPLKSPSRLKPCTSSVVSQMRRPKNEQHIWPRPERRTTGPNALPARQKSSRDVAMACLGNGVSFQWQPSTRHATIWWTIRSSHEAFRTGNARRPPPWSAKKPRRKKSTRWLRWFERQSLGWRSSLPETSLRRASIVTV